MCDVVGLFVISGPWGLAHSQLPTSSFQFFANQFKMRINSFVLGKSFILALSLECLVEPGDLLQNAIFLMELFVVRIVGFNYSTVGSWH